jgi:hypothetical protein
MQYVPLPQKLGLAGWWEKDDDRTTPPPLPIDVMLKAGWMVQKSHNSIPGVFVSTLPLLPNQLLHCMSAC